MSSSTALSVVNYGLAGLWDYFYSTITSGGVLYFVIAIAVLFTAIRIAKRLLHNKV